MATTGVVIQALLDGIVNPSTGAAAASGVVRFYQPGTLTAQNVYSDDACTTAITQPYTLGSGGEAKLFMLDPVRMIVKDSSDTTTLVDTVLIQRHDQLYVTHASFNSGAETTLEAILTTAATSFGTGFQYLESAGATARNYSAWLGEAHVSVLDFAADNTGVSDASTAIQAAMDRVEALGGGWCYFPAGTYRIDSALTIDTAGVKICGAGRAVAIISNQSTTGNAFTINLGSAVDSKIVIKEIGITANTTSSGTAIAVTNGDRIIIEGVSTALHRTGIDCSAVSGARVVDCVIASTDDNASAVGITSGTRGRVDHCEVVSGTDNGSGIVLGAGARGADCYVSNFATGLLMSGNLSQARGMDLQGATTGATVSGTSGCVLSDSYVATVTTGISVTGTDAKVRGCTVTSATTGISLAAARAIAQQCVVSSATTGVSLGAANVAVLNNYVTGCTTGITVGAFASCVVVGNTATGSTTDISVNGSASLLVEHSNTYSVISDSALTPHSWLKDRAKVYRITQATSSSTTPTFTPTPTTCDIYVCECTAGAPTTPTIAATATTGLVNGQELIVIVSNRLSTADTVTSTFNAQYAKIAAVAAISQNGYGAYRFVWIAATSTWASIDINQANNANTADPWN